MSGELRDIVPDSAPRFNRRRLGTLAVGGVLVLLPGCADRGRSSTPTASPDLPAPISDKDRLIDAIEGQFGITLYHPESTNPDGPVEWDMPRLESLRGFLPRLPEDFYEPDENKNKLRIALTNRRSSSFSDTTVTLSAGEFGTEDTQKAFSVLTRELVGRATPLAVTSDGTLASPWYDGLEGSLGKEWSDLSSEISQQANYNLFVQRGGTTEQKEFYAAVYNSIHVDPRTGSQADSPRRFIATVSGDYVRGDERFTAMYGTLLSKGEVEKLSLFVKKDIFEGRVYEPLTKK